MEVNQKPKRLHRHSLPIFLVAAGLLIISGLTFEIYRSRAPKTESVVARGLITRFIHVGARPDGLIGLTLESTRAPHNSPVGASLSLQKNKVGTAAQLYFNLHAGAAQ